MDRETIDILANVADQLWSRLPKRLRPFTSGHRELPRAVLVTGPRGCGKSTFLLHHSQGRRMFYLSADNPLVSVESLFGLANDIFMLGYEGLVVDEVHHIKDWSVNLKAVYDAFPDKKIWASDSSSLVLRYGNADLSRRFLSVRVPLLSFREYLFLETGVDYPVWRLGDAKLPMEPDTAILSAFESYRAQGMCPYYQEGDFNARAMNVINKTLLSDVPFFIPSVNENSLRLMSAIIGTLAASSIPRLNVTSLCADWNIGAEKLYKMLRVMESVDLLRVVRYERDTKANIAVRR